MLTCPALLLKVEDALLLIVVLGIYSHLHLSWMLFGVLFLAPDLSMLGYLGGPSFGAAIYNLVHTLAPVLALGLVGWSRNSRELIAITLIWIAHIAMDRVLGFGLKYPTFFKDTHLQRLETGARIDPST
jgi:hypothetical protein